MTNHVKTINATGIHGRFDLHQDFQPGINIIYGKNGTGKTTLLHILSNALNSDFNRFAFLRFKTISVELDDGTDIDLIQRDENDDRLITVSVNGQMVDSFFVKETQTRVREVERDNTGLTAAQRKVLRGKQIDPFLPTAYFPAFRTMIEAWVSIPEDPEFRVRYDIGAELYGPTGYRSSSRQTRATQFARQLFGNFTPTLNFPSPQEIEQRIGDETQEALLTVAATDRDLLSKAFLDILPALSSQTDQTDESFEDMLTQIKALSEKLEESPLQAKLLGSGSVYADLLKLVASFRPLEASKSVSIPILMVYRDSLRKRVQVQKQAFQVIELYLASVNEFLEGKQLEIMKPSPSNRKPSVQIRFSDRSHSRLSALSSGERQIVTLIYSSTHMSSQRTVLIDEPEISLHIDWQRLLLKKMSEQLEDRQIIACTHSPVIGADYASQMKELRLEHTPIPVQLPLSGSLNSEDED